MLTDVRAVEERCGRSADVMAARLTLYVRIVSYVSLTTSEAAELLRQEAVKIQNEAQISHHLPRPMDLVQQRWKNAAPHSPPPAIKRRAFPVFFCIDCDASMSPPARRRAIPPRHPVRKRRAERQTLQWRRCSRNTDKMTISQRKINGLIMTTYLLIPKRPGWGDDGNS